MAELLEGPTSRLAEAVRARQAWLMSRGARLEAQAGGGGAWLRVPAQSFTTNG